VRVRRNEVVTCEGWLACSAKSRTGSAMAEEAPLSRKNAYSVGYMGNHETAFIL
jgi:hypothetical protein